MSTASSDSFMVRIFLGLGEGHRDLICDSLPAAIQLFDSTPTYHLPRVVQAGQTLIENAELGLAPRFIDDAVAEVYRRTSCVQTMDRARQAALFFRELGDSVETLSSIAKTHGVRTLSDLMHLHSAILSGGFVGYWPDESQVVQVLEDLPSGQHWLSFVRDCSGEQT